MYEDLKRLKKRSLQSSLVHSKAEKQASHINNKNMYLYGLKKISNRSVANNIIIYMIYLSFCVPRTTPSKYFLLKCEACTS